MRKVRLGLVVSLAIGALLLATLWKTWTAGQFDAWLKAWLLRRVESLYGKNLPFEIERVHLEGKLHQLLQGAPTQLEVTLKLGEDRLEIMGPLTLHSLREPKLALSFSPKLRLLGPILKSLPVTFHPEVSAEIRASGSLRNSQLHSLQAQLRLPTVLYRLPSIPNAHLETDASELSAEWTKASQLKVQLHVPRIQFFGGTDDHLAILGPLKLDLHLDELPSNHLPTGTLNAHFGSLELLWGEGYLDQNLAPFPLQIRSEAQQVFSFSVGTEPNPWILGRIDQDVPTLKLRKIPIEALQKSLHSLLPKALRPFQFLGGLADSHLRLPRLSHWKSLQSLSEFIAEMDGTLRIHSLGFVQPELELDAHHIDLRASLRSETQPQTPESSFQISIPALQFKRWRGSLASTTWDWIPEKFALIPRGPLPLKLEHAPLLFGPFRLQILKEAFDLETTVATFAPFEPTPLLHALCLAPTSPLPPLSLSVPSLGIEVVGDSLYTHGTLSAQLFNGTFEANDLALEHFSSEVPIYSGSLKWYGLDLRSLGLWSNFGEMDGLVEGELQHFVVQGWLPTQFDFHLQGKPHRSRDLVFSPLAMKNTIKLFSGEDIEVLPGIAKWLAFGWPSRVFGGYNVDYFGLRATSRSGSILIETLEDELPKSFTLLPRDASEHFILYGPRFRMPLRSARYPLVIDATAMNNFGRHLWMQLKGLKGETREGKLPPENCHTPLHLQSKNPLLKTGI
jgi:hypothetical protein